MLNATAAASKPASRSRLRLAKKRILRNFDLYLLIIPVLMYFAIFHYGPMYGASIAFKDFSPMKGIAGSTFVGFDQFTRFFNSYFFWRLIRNTLVLSLYTLAVTFPIPILLALMINEIRNRFFKKLSQNVSYLPHFLSTADRLHWRYHLDRGLKMRPRCRRMVDATLSQWRDGGCPV